ncbi:hypothetical protein [Mesorhizobium sp. B1-1-6]|uniref:hypothetical protein n=1 Tax=Mesorhizobium sp. B1-1-6 TaxID=2589978 RepID=UPI0011296B61|nr:hypothetical protein [Mesorhizobium sp. B1-1-6]TPN35198.1 hypothetical protein FJ979_20165 [Mesorhizobium sp. B1-1-6]
MAQEVGPRNELSLLTESPACAVLSLSGRSWFQFMAILSAPEPHKAGDYPLDSRLGKMPLNGSPLLSSAANDVMLFKPLALPLPTFEK